MKRLALLLSGLVLLTGTALAQDFDRELGAQTYANCAGCHQADGAGLPGVFPPLAAHAPALVAAEGGRAYLIDVLLYGLQGEIMVDGAAYNGVMPGWAQLSDEQIAAVINHILSAWDNESLLPEDFVFVAPDEVAAQRGTAMTAERVHELRGTLTLP